MDSIRTLLSIAVADDTEIVQFDVKTAFLYGTLDEDIYMDPPHGLEVPSGFVCHLKKSLYGLKQASRCWNKKFNDFLTRYDLLPSSADPYIYVSSGEPRIITTIVVDDGLAICPSKHHLDDMICYLKEHFESLKDQLCRAPLLEECPQHHGHKGDPGVTPGTCGTIGERAQVIPLTHRD